MPQVADRNARQAEYWRSLEQLADTPEFRRFVEDEFPSQLDAVVDPVSRRRFVQVMGASLALAGLTGCDLVRWPQERILPFASRPMNRTPGKPVQFATTIDLGGRAQGLLVTSYDGRPIKVEGNPQHPESLGATDAFAQALVLELYDPDRTKQVLSVTPPVGGAAEQAEPSTWDAFLAWAKPKLDALKAKQGEGLVVVAGASSSPTLARLKARLLSDARYPKARWVEWEPLSGDAALAGARLAFGGKAHRAHLRLDRAQVIASFDADLLGDHPAGLRHAREFARGRRGQDGAMNRLWVVEGTFSNTGSTADERLPVPTSRIEGVALALAAELGRRAPELGLGDALLAKAAAHAPAATDPVAGFVAELADDLLAHRGASVLAAGPRQPASLHALLHALNAALGNVGATVSYTAEPGEDATQRPTHQDAMRELAGALKGGASMLLVLDSNPVFTAPVDLGLAEAMDRVPARVHLGLWFDETARRCHWHLPMAHALEGWSDARAHDGTVSLAQPLIAPLYAGRTAAELLALLLNELQKTGYDLVRRTFQDLVGVAPRGDDKERFERAWRQALHDGVLAGSALPATAPKVALDAIAAALPAAPAAPASRERLELTFTADDHVHDGRFANNAWLQEKPSSLTKLTWDNAALVSPFTAKELGLKGDDVVRLTVDHAGQPLSLEVPVHVLPGLPSWTVALSLGYGRTAAGVVGDGCGFDAYKLRTSTAPWSTTVALVPAGRTYALATTQDHHSIDTEIARKETHRRVFGEEIDGSAKREVYTAPLFQEATLSEYVADPHFAKSVPGPDPATTQLWQDPIDYSKGHRWGMAIDLSACTGCGACVVACQAENNIPVVGKSEVIRGREMHWLRIDRYFKGDPLADPLAPVVAPAAPGGGPEQEGEAPRPAWQPRRLEVAHQPVPCMQCENAPCEAVCPVAATTHSEEGLNDMAYNRCVGTRYCANNCAYKVRRFNYFWNHHGPFHPRSLPIAGQPELPKPPQLTARLTDTEKMYMNPEVTIRARGVMEKCTYCVQRIKAASIPARNEKRKVRDGEIRTACQQVCPSEAIVFGDLNDPESQVSKLQGGDRSYSMLALLNARPRTQYLAKLRNPAGGEA